MLPSMCSLKPAGIDEPLEAPLAYLRHELGDRFDEAQLHRGSAARVMADLVEGECHQAR